MQPRAKLRASDGGRSSLRQFGVCCQCEVDRTEDAGAVAERRRDDELIDLADLARELDIATNELFHLSSDDRQKAALLRHAAAEHDTLRRKGEERIRDPDREVMRLERPGRPIVELFGGLSVAGEQRFSGSHALETVTMEWAGAGERIVAVVMRDEH